MIGLIGMIIFGLVIGAVAKLLMPGRDPGGWVITCLLGVAGSLLGGFLGRSMGFYTEGQAAGWIMSILGAVLLLFLYRMVAKGRTTA